jgi:glycosyltransferase involved in cell wall biosynthesis
VGAAQSISDLILVHNSTATLGALRGDLIRLALEKDIRVHALVPRDHQGPYPQFFESPRFRVSDITLNRMSLGIVGQISSLTSIRGHLKQSDPSSFVIVTTIKPIFYVGLLKRLGLLPHHLRTTALITGLGFVFFGDSWKSRLLRGFLKPFYGFALKSYSKLLFQNKDDLDFFRGIGLISPSQNAECVGSGVDLDWFSTSAVPLNPIRFLFVGRLLRSKGLLEFLEAAQIVKSRHPHVEFEVVGGFDSNPEALQMKDLEPYVRNGVIHFQGYLSDVRDALRKSACIVLPSYREGVPRVILEAMSSGRAVIVSDAPGCKEMVEDSVTGVVVPVRDSSALAQAMERVIQSPHLLSQFGAAGRKIAESQFDQRQINQRILRLAQGFDD